jgi:hypothetical protein
VLPHHFLPAVAFIVAFSLACSPSTPVISSPLEGWEDEQGRRASAVQSSQQPRPQRRVKDVQDSESRESTAGKVETALADIIGFPFRAAAWLAHTLL